jgi:hypothetical protein
VTTIAALEWLSIAVGAVAVIDCVRRPQSAWVAADRTRAMWVTWIVLASILFLGIPIVLVYLLAIVPRLSQRSLTSEFEKPSNFNQ